MSGANANTSTSTKLRSHPDRVRRTDGSGIDEEEGVEEGYEYGGADDDESVISGGGSGSMGHGSVGGAILADSFVISFFAISFFNLPNKRFIYIYKI